jgi:hypothetical protein
MEAGRSLALTDSILPGFNTMSINPSGNNGKWKIEFYIWNRDTQESILIDSKEFYIAD